MQSLIPRPGQARIILWKISDAAVITILAVFAFWLTFKTGQRGFFALDQSIVFDGSYRIISGQVPYKDFVIPYGPLVFWLQAVFFKLLGVSYFSYIFGAALVNSLAVICSLMISRIIFTKNIFISWVAGLITAIWFYPPSGTTYTDQTAFFLSLVTIVFLLFALLGQGSLLRRKLFLFLSGVFAFLSLITKQNIGLFMLPLYFLLIIAANPPNLKGRGRVLLIFFSGLLISAVIFGLWIARNADPGLFIQYVFKIPAELGIFRIFSNKMKLYKHLTLTGPLSDTKFIIIIFLAIFMLAFYFYRLNKIKNTRRKYFIATTLCIYLFLAHYFFIRITLNDPENSFPYLGIVLALAFGVFSELIANRASIKVILPKIFLIIFVIVVFRIAMYGLEVSLDRKVQDGVSGSAFFNYLNIRGLEHLKWAQPTQIRGFNIPEKDISDLFAYLRQQDKNFFIFPDFTIFYGLLKKPSSQPLLWFHKGLTYPFLYDAALDKWIVDSLIKNKVEIIILERLSFLGTPERLSDFPQLSYYLKENFARARQIGIFIIYQKRNT